MAEISGDSTFIGSDDVDSRIEVLENEQDYKVVRLRNDDVLAIFDDEEDALQYITDEDYNPERVIVRQRKLDEDDAQELRNLTRLRESVGSGSWTLYNENYFDVSWARDEAAGELGVSFSQLDDWPLNLVDWSDAANERRDYLYDYIYEFDGTTFYGSE
jgi:hypothetical protein